MTDDRLILAIGRIERALSRLESWQPPVPSPPPDDSALQALQQRYERLDERHRALRARTSSAVDRLTRLLDPSPSASGPDTAGAE